LDPTALKSINQPRVGFLDSRQTTTEGQEFFVGFLLVGNSVSFAEFGRPASGIGAFFPTLRLFGQ
jgi:hypothetical protein